LVSDEVLTQLDGFLTREIGAFLLAGKTKPLVVHELLCPLIEADALKRDDCALFQEALDLFRRQLWDGASRKFAEVIGKSGEDGPSRFYLNLCDRLRKSPPGELWDGVIRMDQK
jgi:adenylate cyclase